jgi:hypothetical protein
MSLDFLGALTPTEAKKERAAAAGKRAVAAGQKLAKRAPRLAAAIVAAGQKALKAGGAKPATPSPVAAPAPVKAQPAPSPAAPSASGLAPQPQRRAAPASSARRVPTPPARNLAPAKRRMTKVGEDGASDEQQADIYAQLSDAATSVAEFVGYFQGLLEQIPSNLPLHQNGLGTISQFENWFGKPLEAALQGDQAALAKVPDVNGLLEYFKGQGEATEKRWPWDWASLAETYLKLHPPAEPTEEPAPAPTREPAPAPTPAAEPVPAPVPVPQSPAAPVPSSPAPAPAPSYGDYGGGYGGGYAEPAYEPAYEEEAGQDMGDGQIPAYYQEPHEEEYAEAQESGGYADEGEYYGEEEYEEPMDEIGELEALLGHNGAGGKGGGKGHHHGGHRPRGGGGGPFYWGYPYWPTTGIEIDDQLTESDLDDIADELADRVAQKVSEKTKPVRVMGLDLLGDDSWLAIHTRADYANAANQLKASAENLNQTAKNEPGWPALYQNALALWQKYHDVGFFSSINPFSDQALTDAAWNAIADAQRRVDEFATQMRSQGKRVVEPAHKPIDNSLVPTGEGSTVDWMKKHWVGLAVGGAAIVTLPAILPPIIGAAMAAKGRR